MSLTDATTSTTLASYIFAGHSVFGPDIATQVGSPLRAADLFDDPTGGISLGAGSTVGLGHVTFDVAAAAAGVYTLSLLPAPDTSLAFQGNDVPIDLFQNGTITVASVPEPAGLVLATAGILSLAAGRLFVANAKIGLRRTTTP